MLSILVLSILDAPTMFIAELEHPRFHEFDLSSLRTGIMAGSPCPVEVMKKVQSDMHMSEVTICYGMTETSPVSFQTAPDDPVDKRVSTVGRIHPHVEAKVVDPDSGRILPRDTPGELCTRGYLVMLGYWRNDDATAGAIDRAGWMHTGDLATVDADGYANIVGRIKDMVIRGGENVYPREVEEFLYQHPAIGDVQVSAFRTRGTARSCAPGCGSRRASRWTATSCASGARGRSPPSRSPATGGSSTPSR